MKRIKRWRAAFASGAISIFFVCACGKSGSAGGSSQSAQNVDPLKSPVPGEFLNNPVSLNYGLAILLSPGQSVLGESSHGSSAKMAVVFSEGPLSCATDFTSDHWKDFTIAFRFENGNAGSKSSEVSFVSAGGGSGGLTGGAYGNIGVTGANSVQGHLNFHYTTSAFGTTFVDAIDSDFNVPTCF